MAAANEDFVYCAYCQKALLIFSPSAPISLLASGIASIPQPQSNKFGSPRAGPLTECLLTLKQGTVVSLLALCLHGVAQLRLT